MSGKRYSPTLGLGRRSRWWRRVIVTLVLLLLAGACGSDESSDDMAAAEAAAAAAEAAASSAPATTAAMAEEMVEEEAMAALDEVQMALAEPESEALEAADAASKEAEAASEAEVASDEAMAEEASADEMAEGDVSSVDDTSSEGAVVNLSTANSPAAFGRDVIYRAWVSVEAPDVAAATNQAISIVQGLGGFVFGQQTRSRPSPYSEIVFKVLPEDFSVALARLSQVGELVDQQISADDVTERIVDLQSQIITAEASVGRLRSFLETATNLENVAFYERELLIRETDLERLRGQVRTLQDQVALATITLAISQLPERPVILPNTGMVVTAWASTGNEDPCLGHKDLTVERDDTVNFCVEVANVGEVTLTDVELSSDVLPLDDNPFAIERGSFEIIEPGQFLTATLTEEVVKGRLADRIATRGLQIRIESTASPEGAEGTPGVISDTARVLVTAQQVIPRTGILVHAWVSTDDDDPCLGARDITVEPDGGIVNLCVFVGNSGDVPITDIQIQSPALDLEANPLVLEHGSFERIEPRQFLTATLTERVAKGRFNGRVATRGLDIEISSAATPLDADGTPLETVADATGISLTAQEVLPETRMAVSAWASADDDDPCLGSQGIALASDEDKVNFCLEIGNLGDTALTDIRIESHSLRLDENPFVPDYGDFGRIESGQFLTATLTETVENGRMAGRLAIRGINVGIEVTATPVDEEGAVLEDTSAWANVSVDVLTGPRDDGTPAGFGDALGSSMDALVSVLGGLALVIGALIPFLPFIAIVLAFLWWRRRRKRLKDASQVRHPSASSEEATSESSD